MLAAISRRAKHFLLHYTYVPDMLTRRTPFRPAHLAVANEFTARGALVWGGAYQNPVDGGELMFEGETDAVVREFVSKDPYVKEGLVPKYAIREVLVVGGTLVSKK